MYLAGPTPGPLVDVMVLPRLDLRADKANGGSIEA